MKILLTGGAGTLEVHVSAGWLNDDMIRSPTTIFSKETFRRYLMPLIG